MSFIKWFVGIGISLIMLWVALLIGFSYETEVTEDADLWGEYTLGKEYVLERPVFLIESTDSYGGKEILIPEESYKRCLGRHAMAPNSIAEYRKDPVNASVRKFDSYEVKVDVIGIAEKGTRISPSRLVKSKGWSLWFGSTESLRPYAIILDGQFKGKEVGIMDISIYYRNNDGPFLYRPETGVVRNIEHAESNYNAKSTCS
jgi:hypothetical protein